MTEEQYKKIMEKIDAIAERTNKMDAELQRIRILMKIK